MINRIKALLRGAETRGTVGDRTESEEVQLAAAALLVEAAVMDGHFDEVEERMVASLLTKHFHLEEPEVAVLMEEARMAVDSASQLYGFTRVVKDRFSEEDRIRMIEMLWSVAYADGHLHDYEASLVRRVAGLIYVPDRDSGAARKRALERLGLTDAAESLKPQ